jgi:hypothetical protein
VKIYHSRLIVSVDDLFKRSWNIKLRTGEVLSFLISTEGQAANFCERGNEHSGFIKCSLLASQEELCFVELY